MICGIGVGEGVLRFNYVALLLASVMGVFRLSFVALLLASVRGYFVSMSLHWCWRR